MSHNSGINRARNFKSASRFALGRFRNYSPDYSLNCTPLGPITITNHNYIKILESDWSPTALISVVIGQLYASCLSNWTVRVIKLALVALEWFFSASNLEVEYINLSNSLYHCHILLEFCCSYDLLVIGLRVV